MNVAQCDCCRDLGPLTGLTYPPSGWLSLSLLIPRDDDRPSALSAIYGPSAPVMWQTAGVFCSWKCAAEYCIARALLAEEQAPSE